MDRWAEDHEEEVIIQTGYSTYEPKKAVWQKLYPYSEMTEYVSRARIVITHGGPSSFIMPLQIGKIPVVVPRRAEFHEHVNDHQAEFARAVEQRQGNIIVVEKIEELGSVLDRYDEICKGIRNGMQSNNAKFCADFGKIVNELARK